MTECPQWQLRTPHYLKVPGVVWEQTEISRESGRQARQTYNVPSLIDPNDPSQCNRDGECIVYHAVEGAKGPKMGFEFVGEPTPEMEPMNEEAQAISDSLKGKWAKSFETFQIENHGDDYSAALFRGIEKALSEAIKQGGGIPTTPVALPADVVSRAEYDALKEQIAQLTASLGAKAEAETEPKGRRV